MAVSVGVVTSHHWDCPRPPVQGFLEYLYQEIAEFLLEDPEPDEVALETNEGLTEFDQRYLDRRADEWAGTQILTAYQRAVLHAWIASLPWRGDGTITLQLGR